MIIMLFTFIYLNCKNIYIFFSFLNFLGFLNIVFFNEELIICLSLLLYFLALFLVLRKLVLNFFFLEIEYFYLLFSLILGLNFLILETIKAYFNFLYNCNYFFKNNKFYILFSVFLDKFLMVLSYYELRFKKFLNSFNYINNYNYCNFFDIYYFINNKFFYKIISKNIDYIIVKILCLFNQMYVISINNIIYNYVS